MKIQTRSNDGGLAYFESIFEAFEYAKNDPEVWKISWTEEVSQKRIRFVRSMNGAQWTFDPILIPDMSTLEEQ